MNTGFSGPSIPFRSIHRLIQSVLSQLKFSFHRHQPIRADFSGGQITSDAGLLPLRAFDQRHHLTRDWAADLSDPRQNDRLRHDSLALSAQDVSIAPTSTVLLARTRSKRLPDDACRYWSLLCFQQNSDWILLTDHVASGRAWLTFSSTDRAGLCTPGWRCRRQR
jgi:Transposase DDE domain group 1